MSDHDTIGSTAETLSSEDAGVALPGEGDKTASRAAKGRPVLDFVGSHPEDALLYEKMPVLGKGTIFCCTVLYFIMSQLQPNS